LEISEQLSDEVENVGVDEIEELEVSVELLTVVTP
jgi:hypothetical protein